jgi:uncharacterized protein YndB with AHSA1/START domain
MSDDAEAPPTNKVVFDCDLDAPPEKVWRALTEPELVAAWLTEGDIAEKVECEVLTEGPGRQIRYGWRQDAHESVVTFAVSATPSGGSHLRLVHEYFGDMIPVSSSIGPVRAGRRERSIVSSRYPHRGVHDRHRVPRITTMRWAA